VVERFIAPVLKTGEPLRVPGVRIPPPLLIIIKACKSYDFRLFSFRDLMNFPITKNNQGRGIIVNVLKH
jgi:hypothetical protein